MIDMMSSSGETDALTRVKQQLERRLPDVIERHDIPGASLAIWFGGKVAAVANSGVLNRATGAAVTSDAVFQIGSITKVWTAALVMQLVDEGLISLDAPVRAVLPDFTTDDQPGSAAITVRQLLSHSAGFEGDLYEDPDETDEAIGRFVMALRRAHQFSDPGEIYSYNNAGYVVLGRIVEVLRCSTFEDALRKYLADPLGLDSLAFGPEEAALRRAAVGHIHELDAVEVVPAGRWFLPRTNAPAGTTLCLSAADLVRFAAMHLGGGLGPQGTRVLTANSVQAMQSRQIEVPYLAGAPNARGLGWAVWDLPGGTVIGHNGGTVGQFAFLKVVPEKGLAVALLTNGGDAPAAFEELFADVLHELGGIGTAPLRESLEVAASRTRGYAGRYRSSLFVLDVSEDPSGRLWLDQVPQGILLDLGEVPERYELVPLDPNGYAAVDEAGTRCATFQFVGADALGRAKFLFDGRATPREG